YCVFDIHTGDLSQIAVPSEYRRKGVASRLLQEVTARLKTDFIKVLNISPDNPAMSVFLESKNIPLASKQFEMVLPL
ncbi:MAG: GNAT family N-acetyltransferase, partial [Phocaeicola sp.]|nr:GNAT family N-acetyltransferase [Phocaeicola sp.]